MLLFAIGLMVSGAFMLNTGMIVCGLAVVILWTLDRSAQNKGSNDFRIAYKRQREKVAKMAEPD